MENGTPTTGTPIDKIKSGMMRFDPNYCIGQVKLVATDPKGCWSSIKASNDTIEDVYFRYLVVLAALGPLCGFLGMEIFGVSVPFVSVTYRPSFFPALINAFAVYLLSLGLVYVAAFVLEKLTPSFGGSATRADAFKLLAFGSGPSLVAGALRIMPMLGGLIGLIAGIFSLYAIFHGITPMLGVPAQKRVGFLGASFVIMLVVCFVAMMILHSFIPTGYNYSPASNF